MSYCRISYFCCSLQMLEQIVKIPPRFMSVIISTEDFGLYMQHTAVALLSNTLDSAAHLAHVSLKSIWSRRSLKRIGSNCLRQLQFHTLFS